MIDLASAHSKYLTLVEDNQGARDKDLEQAVQGILEYIAREKADNTRARAEITIPTPSADKEYIAAYLVYQHHVLGVLGWVYSHMSAHASTLDTSFTDRKLSIDLFIYTLQCTLEDPCYDTYNHITSLRAEIGAILAI